MLSFIHSVIANVKRLLTNPASELVDQTADDGTGCEVNSSQKAPNPRDGRPGKQALLQVTYYTL